jgi:septum site-determining protein MinC
MRGRSYVAFVFTPEIPIVGWLAEIDATLARSPGFFVGKPVVLDLAALDLSRAAITHLVNNLEERNIRVLGIEGVDAERLTTSMPPLLTGGRSCVITRTEPVEKPEEKFEPKPKPNSLLLESPVRSGQSIVFTDGDVTVLGSVGSGAEIVAGGSIHVYGTLRGRASAGAQGNTAARVFCRRNEAELLSVDGWYCTAEEMDPSVRGKPVQAFLDNGMLRIAPVS